MAARDYYGGGPLGTPSPVSDPPPRYDDQPRASPTPGPHLSAGSRQNSDGISPDPSPVSSARNPFNTMFDSEHDSSAHTPGTAFQTPASSQFKLNDIPLQEQRGSRFGKDAEGEDHVYDTPLSGASQKKSGRKRRVGWGELGMLGANNKNRIPWVTYLFTMVQIGVFIGEIAKNAALTGSPIETKPSFNIMIGPSPYVLINMGARFVPCMHNVEGVQNATQRINWPCPNTTTSDTSDPTQKCTLSDLCGFGGVPEPYYNRTATIKQDPEPDQWWRFIVPIFLHAGLIHIGFNMLMQLTAGREMERSIGPIRYFIVYMSAGIFGFVMGANFAAVALASTGASGSLFGIIALTLLDLLYSWKDRRSPVRDLVSILVEIVISFVLGLLPGLDNFSHIGGFFMGLALGLCLLHSPNSLRRKFGEEVSYVEVRDGLGKSDSPSIFRNPVGFFKGRQPLWWAWWLVRAAALVFVLVVFILLLNNFYVYRKTCGWCKYLSCLPVNGWCDNNLTFTTTTNSNSNNKRGIMVEGIRTVARFFVS